VAVGCPTVLRSPINEDPAERDAVLIEDGRHTMIEQIGYSDRCFAVRQYGAFAFGLWTATPMMPN
jgi:hypothetical protein